MVGRWLLAAALFLVGCSAGSPSAAGTPSAAGAPSAPGAAPETSAVSIHLPIVQAQPPPRSTPPPAPPTAPPTAPAPCRQPGAIRHELLHSALGGPMPYRVYEPPCYGLDGRVYPALYLLPGNIHTDSIWDDLGIDETAESAILAGTLPPLLIVMPSGGWLADNTSGGPGSYERFVLDELIPQVESTRCAWSAPAGRAIGGLSRGGYWALEIAFRNPARFASAGGHSAALLDQFAGPALDPQVTGLTQPLGALRVYLDAGDADYLRAPLVRLHEDMARAGIAHAWQPGAGGHDDAYWRSQLPDYLAWYTAVWPLDRSAYPTCP